MHTRHDHDRMNFESLGNALRGLPAAPPPHDAWPKIAARARLRRRFRGGLKITLPLAAAAAIVVAILAAIPIASHHLATPHRTVTITSQRTPVPSLIQLRLRSERLQMWTRHLQRNGPSLSGRALAQIINLQDRISRVDVALNANQSASRRADLWSQRIVLLQQLAITRAGSARHYVAETRL